MAKVQDVARLFIDIAEKEAENEQGDGMSNLKLQKLLYFAQGWYMARYGKPLFDEPMEAWRLGPVVPSVYAEYQRFGKNPIHDAPPAKGAFTREEYDLLMDVVREYWRYSASALINMAHEPGTPWAKVYEKDVPHIPLSLDAMREYFSELPPLRTFNEILDSVLKKHPPISPVRRTSSGVPIYPAEVSDGWDY